MKQGNIEQDTVKQEIMEQETIKQGTMEQETMKQKTMKQGTMKQINGRQAEGKQANLLEEPVNRLFFKYLAPSISATLVTSIYILADTVMIGRGVGAIGVAALNIILPMFSLFFGTGILLGVGGGVLFSVSKGKGDERGARQYFTVAFFCAVVLSVFYVAGSLLFFEPITRFLGSTAAMKEYVDEYGYYICIGAPAFLLSSFLQAFVRNDKAPHRAMAAVIAGGVSNVILDYIFIFPWHMGMAGAAIASIIGTLITIVILLTHFLSPANTLKLCQGGRPAMAGRVVVSGLSSFLIELANGAIIFLFNRQLLSYVGDLGVVVYGIISNSALIVNSVCNGIGQALQPIAAVNFGAGNGERVEKTRHLGMAAALAAGILFMSFGLFFPQVITEVFVKADDEILQMAVPAVRVYFISFSAMGLNILLGTYFQSVMKPAYALVICLLRGLIFSGLFVFLLPLVFGVEGIWMTMPVTEAFTLVVGLGLLKRKRDG